VGNNALKLKQSIVAQGRGFKCEVSGVLFDGRPHSATGMGYNKASCLEYDQIARLTRNDRKMQSKLVTFISLLFCTNRET